jgi:hypothetical protein
MLSRGRAGSSHKGNDKADAEPLLSFSLPTSDFERFMLVKTAPEYTERLPMTAHFVTWNGTSEFGSLRLDSS